MNLSMPRRIESNKMDNHTFYGKFTIAVSGIKSLLSTSAAKCIAMYFCWVALHYVSANLYVKFCTPSTFYGFIISPFIIDAPHCVTLRWVLFNGATNIKVMWTVLGTYMIVCLEKFWQ